jgi:hypothetical protein
VVAVPVLAVPSTDTADCPATVLTAPIKECQALSDAVSVTDPPETPTVLVDALNPNVELAELLAIMRPAVVNDPVRMATAILVKGAARVKLFAEAPYLSWVVVAPP